MKHDMELKALFALILIILCVIILGWVANHERNSKKFALEIDAVEFKELIKDMDHGTITIMRDGQIKYRRYGK